jgi:hypothetical protein
MSVTPIEMEAAVGAKKTLTLNFPAAPLYFGFRPTELFQYHTLTTLGVLALYLYPAGVASDKVLLAEVTLEDAAVVGNRYMVKVANIPATGTSQGHAKAPVANCVPGDQLVVYIKTQGVGDAYILGEFQPVLFMQYRGEGFVGQDAWIDRTPVSAGISSAM